MQRCRIESLGVSLPRGRSLLRWGSLRHAVAAGRRCLAGSRYHAADVGVLINSGVHRDGHCCEPAMAATIQHRLGINIEFQGRCTLAFDLLNGACGMLSAAQVLVALLQSGGTHAGMVISSEANSDRRPDPAYTYPPSGAALLLDLAPRRQLGFGAFAFQVHDQHAGLYVAVVSLAEKRGRLLLRRRVELEDVYLAHAAAVVDEALEREGLSRADVDLVVPAQLSPAFLARLPAAIGVPAERVLDQTRQLADTHSTSIFLALHAATAAGRAAPGTRALLLGWGSGVTLGAAIYRC